MRSSGHLGNFYESRPSMQAFGYRWPGKQASLYSPSGITSKGKGPLCPLSEGIAHPWAESLYSVRVPIVHRKGPNLAQFKKHPLLCHPTYPPISESLLCSATPLTYPFLKVSFALPAYLPTHFWKSSFVTVQSSYNCSSKCIIQNLKTTKCQLKQYNIVVLFSS